MSKTLSTHVLDATTGNPAAGIRVELRDRDGASVTTAETDSDGRIAEQFRIIHFSGWAPHPDQPRPARRGSGTASLIDALSPRP